MAHDQNIRLRTVQKPEADARIGWMKERALAFYQVPMIGIIRRRQPLDRAGDEIGDDSIDRDTVAGNENSGLTGGAKISLHPAPAHLLLQRQGRVHLADRAIGANRQKALAGPPRARADGEIPRGVTDVEQAPAQHAGAFGQHRYIHKPAMQAGGHIHPTIERFE